MNKGSNLEIRLSRKEIGDVLGMSPDTVTKYLKSVGIMNRVPDVEDWKILKKHCHPLFYKISRITLSKIYSQHPETSLTH